MKAYLAFLGAMLVCSYLAGVQLVRHYRPSAELLQRTSVVAGKLHFFDRGRGGYIARVNGIDFMCRMNFIGAQQECPERVPALREGTQLTAAMVYVPSLTRDVPLAMSISVDGTLVYATTPEQLIDDWNRSSRTALFTGPAVVLFLLFLMPLLLSARFRDFLMSSVD